MKKIIITISSIVVVMVVLLISSMKVINAGQVGVKTRFGKVIGTQLNEGLNFKLPFIEKITKINIKVQKLETTGGGASKDLQDVTIATAINYRVDSQKATDLFRNVGTKYETTIISPAIQESIKSVSASYTAEELITKRQEVSSKMLEELQEKISKYGLKIDNFNIIDFDFSQAFNQAIEEKQVAEQKVATAKNELEKAKIEAEKKIVEAEASAKSNKLMEQSLTNAILTQRFIEKWDGKLPIVSGNQNIMDISSLVGGNK